MKDELKILIPNEEIETSIGTITLSPFKFKHFSIALALISKYLDTFMSAESAYEIAQALLKDAGEQTIADVSSLVTLCSGTPRAELENLTWDEVTQLLLVIVEQNIDFFYRMGGHLGETMKKRSGQGQMDGAKTLAA